MLSWICPDCGCDCAPTDQECPDCSDLVQAGMVALARAVQEQRDSFAPPPEIPLQDRVPVPAPSIEARSIPAEPPRIAEPQPEPMPLPAVMLPMAGTPVDRLIPPPVVAVATQVPPVNTHRRPIMPGWLISLLVATTLSLGGAAIVRNMDANRKAEAASQPAGQASAGSPDSPVEVTGLRVVGGPRFGSQLQYIVVSHSATPLSKLNLKIQVRSTSLPASAPPVLTLTTSINELAPYSSREMSSDIDDAQLAGLPGWERLKAEVQLQ